MTTTVKAIFEGGLLRPLTPLELREGEEVDMTVRSLQEAAAPAPEYIEQLLAELAAAYVPTGQVETTSVDHDKILYGEKGAR
jgi:predicted DNA-binding antitoxin AbrB/MazE fold protein